MKSWYWDVTLFTRSSFLPFKLVFDWLITYFGYNHQSFTWVFYWVWEVTWTNRNDFYLFYWWVRCKNWCTSYSEWGFTSTPCQQRTRVVASPLHFDPTLTTTPPPLSLGSHPRHHMLCGLYFLEKIFGKCQERAGNIQLCFLRIRGNQLIAFLLW